MLYIFLILSKKNLKLFTKFISQNRYSLSEEKLIRQQVEYHQMTVFVSMSPQTIYMSGLDPQGDNMDIPVRCLDCDSISQVNEAAHAFSICYIEVNTSIIQLQEANHTVAKSYHFLLCMPLFRHVYQILLSYISS